MHRHHRLIIIISASIMLFIISGSGLSDANDICKGYDQSIVIEDTHVYENDSFCSKAIGTMKKGDIVCVIDISNKSELNEGRKIYWVQILIGKNSLGYISSRYLRMNFDNQNFHNRLYNNGSLTGNNGIIEGSISYPSEMIPDYIEVCAVNITTSQYYCTQNHIVEKKYRCGKGYKVSVPEGKYRVFAYRPYALLRGNYFIEMKDKPVNDDDCFTLIDVKKGITTKNIDPYYWHSVKHL